MASKKLMGALAAMAAGALCSWGAAGGTALTPFYAAMNGPQAPFKIADNLYYVGASDVTSYLIVTKDGDILIDGGFEQTAPMILEHIQALGFAPKDVKIILNSHAHFDHAGGIAALKAATGARFAASAGDAPALETGDVHDFSLKDSAFPPVKPDRIVADGETVALGGVTLTAHVTAGHTKGCTSWTMRTTMDSKPEDVLFLCSLSVLPQYRLIGNPLYPGQADDYARSFATLKSLRCDVFLGAHGSFFGLKDKLARLGSKANPFIDPKGCRAFISAAEATFQARLAACKADPACGKREDQ